VIFAIFFEFSEFGHTLEERRCMTKEPICP